jgi:hypothetical protein
MPRVLAQPALDERDADRRVTYPELAESFRSNAEGYRLGGQIDAHTTIRIKGCALGQSRGMVELIDQGFGAAERVIAPTHPQNYSRVGGEVVEHYSRTELSLPGDVHLPRAELVSRFRDRDPQIPESFWRRAEGLPVFSRHVRRIRVPGSVEHARGETGRAEAYAWSPGRHAASGVLTE